MAAVVLVVDVVEGIGPAMCNGRGMVIKVPSLDLVRSVSLLS